MSGARDPDAWRRWQERWPAVLDEAREEARRLKHGHVGVDHVFIALARGPDAEALLRAQGLDPTEVRDAIRREAGTGKAAAPREPALTARLARILETAESVDALQMEAGPLSPEGALLRAILEEGDSLPARYLRSRGLDAADVGKAAAGGPDDGDAEATRVRTDRGGAAAVAETPLAAPPPRVPAPGDVPLTLPTPTLDQLGRDLTRLARLGKLGEVVGRAGELRQLITVLTRTLKSSPLLLGEAGVGKTAIVEGLAVKIARGDVPSVLAGKRIVELDVAGLVAGTSFRGQFEERVRQVLKEASEAPEVILMIDEVHTLVGAGETSSGSVDAAAMFKPALARGEIRCIGATTQDEYARHIRKDPALERRFSPIVVEELSTKATLSVLAKVAERILAKHAAQGRALALGPDVLASAVSLSDRYLRDRHQPDKAIDALDMACARAVVEGRDTVSAGDVAQVISDWTGIPSSRLTTEQERRFADMEAALRARVVGQDAAVEAVSAAVRVAMAGLKPARRPVGVFLFMGPSGVGKTRLAKELAAFLFGTEDALLRFDMNEYQERHSVSNLIGSPRGYVGSEQGGVFSEAVRRRPYSVVLLDEIEKAHPDVMNVFLAAFDEGRITDNQGRLVDCSNVLFVLTSNLREEAQVGYTAAPSRLRASVAQRLRPELVNRISEVIAFAPLGRPELARILDLLLAEKVRAFLNARQRSLSVDPSVKDLVLAQAFDPALGARPLERALDELLVKPLADALLRDELGSGQVRATVQNGRVVFRGEA